MTTKSVIIDDEPLAIELIESHAAQISGLEVVGTFKNAVKALEFLKSHPVDLIFLDIQMPVLSGIDFLKSTNIAPKVIFTTAYRKYALEGYELNVVDYLLKPITFERFFKAMDKYFSCSSSLSQNRPQESADTQEKEYIYVKADKKNVKVRMNDILYVESIKDYIKIQTPESIIIVKEKISVFEKLLPSNDFLRVHRSYLVNIHHITAFTNYDIEINSTEIPIGGIYKQYVLNVLCQ
ncbi:LytR/AlgR family response regulator transcription factor [Nafulsella turpanensis]|uniref:LytR/AlgR family response regulator transcription factor n=1 Tax=Nafulsella turpanensis TaxID=1265690 RepID=UPI00034C1273|nr:LytTR family DNA-binding domain-containing protein [Nafulsella turpanensis]